MTSAGKPSLNSADPFADEPDTDASAAANQTWRQKTIGWYRRNPDLCILALILFVNIVVLGHVTGNGLEPSRIFSSTTWLRARPFTASYSRIDAVVFAFTTSQIALATLWACFSGRNIFTRIGTWTLVVATLTLALMATLNAAFHASELCTSFVSLSLGVAFACLCLKTRGWRTVWDLSEANASDKRLSSREIMILSGIVGLLCVVAACISRSSYSYGWSRFWDTMFSSENGKAYLKTGVLGIATGFIAVFAGVPDKRQRIPLISVCLLGAFGCFTVYSGIHFLHSTTETTVISGSQTAERLAGTSVWALLHLVGQTLVVYSVSAAGIRFSRVNLQETSIAGTWFRRGILLTSVIVLTFSLFSISKTAYRTMRLYNAAAIIDNSGIISKDPYSGRVSIILYKGLNLRQALLLNGYPELEQIQIRGVAATDTQEERDALLNLQHVHEFQWSGRRRPTKRQLRAMQKKRPDATFREL